MRKYYYKKSYLSTQSFFKLTIDILINLWYYNNIIKNRRHDDKSGVGDRRLRCNRIKNVLFKLTIDTNEFLCYFVTTMKNTCAKMRKKDNPYEIWKNDSGWEWRVLKKWQVDDNKPYARWMCAVSSPATYGSYDFGDVYVQEIKSQAVCVYREGGK